MENKFLKKYPTYSSWLVNVSLWIWVVMGILYYFFLIRFDIDNSLQLEPLWRVLFWVVWMLAIDYFFIYRYQKKRGLKQEQEKNLENKE
ncbi:MAG: hypothetical protein ACXIUD_03935 [Mongoliitalea sp.]